MKNKWMGLLAAGIVLPSTAIANSGLAIAREVKVQTPNVEAVTRSDGSVYVNSGRTTVTVPRHRTYNYWTPWRYWRLPWHGNRDRSSCRQSSYQSTSYISNSSRQTIQSSISSNSCK